MPYVAGKRYKIKRAIQGPSKHTSHKCRKCGGFLHGICIVKDPDSDNEMQRVCEVTCASSAAGSNSSAKSAPTTPGSSPGGSHLPIAGVKDDNSDK